MPQPHEGRVPGRAAMLSPKVGDTMVRVIPPVDETPAFIQTGTVDRVTEEAIELLVQADLMRRMRFQRRDGLDSAGTGSFVIPLSLWRAFDAQLSACRTTTGA
jgi:hypothetical protein